MDIIRDIISKLKNALDYYYETEDVDDLISDINEIIGDLIVGYVN